jgi:glycosyltransferase involved in cell wall biosynthesis
MNQGLPLVSIVTPSYNKGSFVEETILSVKNQTYHHIEHIVMDGGSTDETLDILRKYDDSLIWISEPDEGQSDAINKGWRMSKGEILAYLNADDTYMPEAVQTAVEFLHNNPDVGMVYGDADFTDKHGEVTGHYQTGEFDLKRMLCSHNHVPQPTVFFRRDVLDKVGYLDSDLHLAMDLDYWIRISLKFRIEHIPQTLATMRFYPEAKIPSLYYKAVYEHLRILDKFYSTPELSEEIRAFKRQAYGAVHLRASIDYLRAHYKVKALKHLMKALLLHPQCLKNLGTYIHISRLLLGVRATNSIIGVKRKLR